RIAETDTEAVEERDRDRDSREEHAVLDPSTHDAEGVARGRMAIDESLPCGHQRSDRGQEQPARNRLLVARAGEKGQETEPQTEGGHDADADAARRTRELGEPHTELRGATSRSARASTLARKPTRNSAAS